MWKTLLVPRYSPSSLSSFFIPFSVAEFHKVKIFRALLEANPAEPKNSLPWLVTGEKHERPVPLSTSHAVNYRKRNAAKASSQRLLITLSRDLRTAVLN